MKRKLLFGVLIATVAVFTQSCEDDFNEIGSGIFGEDGFDFESYTVQNLNAIMVNTNDVSTKNLSINNFGVYDDPVFGKSIAHFVTQVEMANANTFTSVGNNPIIDSVYVYIPYNSTVSETDSDGNSIYKLNNTYGNGTFTLNVFENGYLLRNFDPNNNLETQEYYSSDKPLFDSNKKGLNGGRINNSTNAAQNTAFRISANEIKLLKYNSAGEVILDSNNNPEVKEKKKPGVWLDLDKTYFQNKFFTGSQYTTLINNNILKEYFKGLYFNVEANGTQAALAQLNISEGELVIVFKQDKSSTDATRERKEIKLNIGFSSTSDGSKTATTVNLIENTNTLNYKNALDANSINPLWIRGNNGSIAAISLFGNDADSNGVADELEQLRENNWLINQAVLTVYVDKTLQTNPTDDQPNRLFIYDAKNNTILTDYILDTSTNKNVYNGLLDVTSESNTLKYRFRITNHINNLIKKDSTNVLLGLSVTSDIANVNFSKLKNPKTSFNTNIKKIPTGSVVSPTGTVLFGPSHSDLNTRMKLDIYYTKQNN